MLLAKAARKTRLKGTLSSKVGVSYVAINPIDCRIGTPSELIEKCIFVTDNVSSLLQLYHIIYKTR
jgi:hypothetical protein